MSTQPVIMQVILTIIAVRGLERIISRLRARQMGLGIVGIWFLGTAIFLLFVWKPEVSTKFSQMIGIGRGVDAVVYIAVSLLFYTTLRILLRLERQENLITQLVSEIALLKNDIEQKK